MVLAHQCWKNDEIVRAQQLLDATPSHLRGWEWEYLNRLCRTGVVRTLDSRTPALYLHDGLGACVTFDRSGKYVAAAVGNGPWSLWNADAGTEYARLSGHTAKVQSVAFSPVDDIAATASRDQTVRLWSVTDRKEMCAARGHDGFVRSVAFSPDGTQVVSGSVDGTVRLWSVPGLDSVAVSEHEGGEVNGVAFSPDGQFVAASGQDAPFES